MKMLITSILIWCLAIGVQAQQDCAHFFHFAEGTFFEYSNYNKTGKLSSRSENEVFLVEPAEKTGAYVATIKSILYDDKNEIILDNQYEATCEDGSYRIDLASMMNSQLQAVGANAEMDVSGDALIAPNDMKVGDELPDASTTIELSAGGVKYMTMEITAMDRKVTAEETITTPAGTFDCLKIEYTTDIKTILRKNTRGADWWAPGVGMVRSESYRKNGKLDSYTELTAFEKE